MHVTVTYKEYYFRTEGKYQMLKWNYAFLCAWKPILEFVVKTKIRIEFGLNKLF